MASIHSLKLKLLGRGSSGPPPAFDYVVTSEPELQAAVTALLPTGGTIGLAPGNYGTSQIQLKNKAAAGRIYISAVTYRDPLATIPGIHFENSSPFTLSGTKLQLLRGGGAIGVVNAINAVNLEVFDNEISADTLATQFLGGSFTVSSVSGAFIEGEQVSVEFAGLPTGGTAFYHDVAGISSPTNFVVSGNALDYKIGNGSGHWSGSSFADRWYDSSSPRTLRGGTSNSTALIGDKTNSVEFLVGVYSSTTQPSPGLKVIGNYIHDTKRGVGISGINTVVTDNTIINSYNAPIDLAGDMTGGVWNNNHCIGVWAQSTDGEPAGTNGPHSSTWGFSFTYRVVTGMQMWGNIGLIGTARQAAGWGIPFATGPKINDMEGVKTISIAAGVATVASAVGTWPLVVGQRVIGPNVLPGTVVSGITSGTGGAGSVFTVSPSQTVGSGPVYIQGRADISMCGNIIDCNGAIGVEWDFVSDTSVYKYNTLFSTRDTRLALPTIPQFYMANIDGGASSHNIMLQPALGDDSRYINEQFYRDSYDNAMLIMGDTSGPGSYEANLQGVGGPTPYSGATLGNIVGMVTPIPGSAAAGRGATEFWNFSTGTPLSPPDPPAPITTLTNGVSMPMVNFAGATNMRWTVAGAENLIDISDPNVLTQVWYINQEGSDASNEIIASSAGSDINIRRLTSGSDNRLRFILKDSTGLTQQIDTIFSLTAADGPIVLALSVDFAAYKIYVWKGATCDPFAYASTWSGLPLRVTSNTLTLMASGDTTPVSFTTGDIGAYYTHDGFLDGAVAADHTKLVALDGKPANYGADGSALLGVQPRVYLAGDQSGYNNPAGFNLGTANGLSKFVRSGPAVTDV